MHAPDLRIVATGLRFPEGPVAMADGSVILVEIETPRLTRVAPDGTKTTIAEMTGGPNGAALGPDGRMYICNNGGFDWSEHPEHGLRPVAQAANYSGGRIERVDLASGLVETLYTECNGHKLRGPNDLVFDTHGGFYFTDLGKARHRDLDRGGIYYAKADGTLIKEVAYPTMTANGCGLSPDGSTLYYAETESARIWALDLDAPGVARRQSFPSPNGAARFVAQCGGFYQRFDSLAVDGAGNICVATLMTGGITIISPDGKSARYQPVPDIYTTNICFGGPDMQTAFLTLSASGRLASCRWEQPGLKLNYA